MDSAVSSPLPARRFLSLDLPYLPTDRLLRLRFGAGRLCAGQAEPPFAVYAKEKGAYRLAALNPAAERLGLKPGQGLAEARAMIPALEGVEADPFADAALLAAIADWADRYTPLAGLDGDRGLMLDISGCAHLFGGEEAMLADLLARLERQGFIARAAIADTPGLAHALARFAEGPVVSSGDRARLIAPLPVAALRLDPDTVFSLERVGLKTTAMLLDAPRAPLAARYGKLLIRRLDQALGQEEEAISPRRAPPVVMAERRFAEPITEEEQVRSVLASLAVSLEKGLAGRGEGARLIELVLYRVDGAVSRLDVGASRPIRAPRRVTDLFAEKFAGLADALDAGYGFDMARLSVLAAERVEAAQADFDGTHEGEADLALLVDRMGARLGLDRVLVMLPRDSHWPERAMVLVPASQHRPSAFPGPEEGPLVRPMRLLPQPEAVESVIAEVPDGPPKRFQWRRLFHDVVHAEGPERLGAEWWRDGDALPSRDYFRIEDEQGHRYWLFREGFYEPGEKARWFMHGLFA
jgi:protein ImuB